MGRARALRLFQSGWRSIDGRVDLLRRLRGRATWRKPSRSEAAQRAAQLAALVADDVRAEVAVRPRAVALLADALGQVEHDRDRQHVVLARQRDERLARLGLHVRRVDDGQQSRARGACAAMKCSTSKASSVADWSFSSSETSPRQKSDESDLGRLEVRARERRLAAARTGRSARPATARESSSVIDARVNTAICVGAPTLGDPRSPTGREAHGVAEARGDAARPRPANSRARPLEAVIAVAELARRAASATARCTRRSASSRRPSPGARTRTATRSNAAQPRRIEMLDHLDDRRRVEAGEPRVAIHQRAVQQRDALALLRRQAIELAAASPPISSARCETSMPTISRELALGEQRAQQPALRRSRDRARATRPLPCSAASTAPRRCSLQAERPLERASSSSRLRPRRPRRRAAPPSASRASASRDERALMLEVAARRSARARDASASQPSPWRSSFSTSSSPTQ